MLNSLKLFLSPDALRQSNLGAGINELPLQYYEKIYDFCRVRDFCCAFEQRVPSQRYKFLTAYLTSLNMEYQTDAFKDDPHQSLEIQDGGYGRRRFSIKQFFGKLLDNPGAAATNDVFFHNIILPGSSSKMLIAHYDVCNLESDNANDNSASVINAIAVKRMRPDLTVVLTDGEEPPCMGAGSRRLCRQINGGVFGQIDWVLNLELTGIGGTNFFTGNYNGSLTRKITEIFSCPKLDVPINDSTILRQHGIDSTVINPLPLLPEGIKGRDECLLKNGRYLDFDVLFRCHSMEDDVSKIRPDEMKAFAEKVVLKIIDS